MKLSTRPISSPSRVEKFPPPLMRFLRTNASSRSRGSRSRASPIFIKQWTMGTAPVPAADTKEPSSPKVTCMGQVRVRRSKQGPRIQGRPRRRRCRWIPRILFCPGSKCGVRVRFSLFKGSKCCTLGWPKWGSFFRFGPRGGVSGKCGFSGSGKDFRDKMENAVEEDEDDREFEGKGNRLGFSPYSPPKNALILTRCRSAPYASSSLACRFWGSPFDPEITEPRHCTEKTEHRLSSEKTEHRFVTEETERENGRLLVVGGEQSEKDSSLEHPPDEEPAVGMNVHHEATNSEGTGDSIGGEDEMAAKSENVEGMEMRDGDMEAEAEVVRPLMLTRCKSEPARTGEKLLDPEVVGGFWRKARLGIVDSCSPRGL